MHIKHIAPAKDARAAADYLTRETNSKGQVRDEVRTLDGNPHAVARIADSLKFATTYTSGVIAWAPGDNPTQEQIHEVLDSYKSMAFAGLAPEQYAFAAVMHRDGEAVHIHTITAKVELNTGKALNIIPPGQEAHFAAVRDYYNAKYDWKDPGASENKRPVQVPRVAKLIAEKQGKEDIREQITSYISAKIADGTVTDRNSMLKCLHDDLQLETPRAGKDYITVIVDDKRIRLKGGIYGQDGRFDTIKDTTEQTRSGTSGTRRDISKLERNIQAIIDKRSQFNQHRFNGGDTRSHSGTSGIAERGERGAPTDPEAEPEKSDDRGGNLHNFLVRVLGTNSILGDSNQRQDREAEQSRQTNSFAGKQGKSDMEQLPCRERESSLPEDKTWGIHSKNRGNIRDTGGEIINNDRDRGVITETVDRANRASIKVSESYTGIANTIETTATINQEFAGTTKQNQQFSATIRESQQAITATEDANRRANEFTERVFEIIRIERIKQLAIKSITTLRNKFLNPMTAKELPSISGNLLPKTIYELPKPITEQQRERQSQPEYTQNIETIQKQHEEEIER